MTYAEAIVLLKAGALLTHAGTTYRIGRRGVVDVAAPNTPIPMTAGFRNAVDWALAP